MGIIVNHSNETAILKYWKLLNIINLVLVPTVAASWLFVPFTTRNLKSNSQLFFRIISIVYAISGSGTVLYCSSELTKLKPKIDSLNKREQAEFKQGLASDLYVAQSTNTAIAQFLIGERQAELIPQYEPLDVASSQEFSSSEEPEQNSSMVQNSSELSSEEEQYLEDVIDALEDGLSDSKIIKEVMGFKNYKYKEGKVILEKIKRILQEER